MLFNLLHVNVLEPLNHSPELPMLALYLLVYVTIVFEVLISFWLLDNPNMVCTPELVHVDLVLLFRKVFQVRCSTYQALHGPTVR